MVLVYTFGVSLIGSQVYSMLYRVTAVLTNPSIKRRFLSWPVVAGFQLLMVSVSAGLSYAIHRTTLRDTVRAGEVSGWNYMTKVLTERAVRRSGPRCGNDSERGRREDLDPSSKQESGPIWLFIRHHAYYSIRDAAERLWSFD